MSRRTRLTVIGLALLAVLVALVLFAFASVACPGDTPEQPCPGAVTNRIVVIGLAALAAGLLAGGAVAVLGGLRLGGALTVPVAIFVVLLAGAMEWLAIRRFDSS